MIRKLLHSKKLWLLVSVAVVGFAFGYGAVAKAFHSNWYGYFFEQLDTNGLEVLPPWGGPGGCQGDGWALPGWVDSPGEFINYIGCKRWNGNNQNRIGAAFIVSTMIGEKNAHPTSGQMDEFAARINYAASRGWINWYGVVGCVLPNTYYQDGPGDVARYSGCGSGPGNAIIISDGATFTYIIKRFCANPLGSMPVLPDDVNYNITGRTTVNDTTVVPGQTITFKHYVRNNGPTATGGDIWWVAERTSPSSGTVGGAANSGAYSAGQEKNVFNHSVKIPANATPNTKYCERVGWDPINPFGGRNGRGTPACATVQYNYTLTPSINASITSSGGPVTGNVAEPGDSVTFTYSVNNSGTTVSQTASCIYQQATHTGYSTAAPTTAFTPSGANCAPTRTFPVGNTTVVTETVNSLPTNRSVCRSLSVAPASFGSSMPSGWSSGDIGSVGIGGSTSVSGGTFTVQASGADIWNAADEFRFVRRSFSGDVDIRARVVSIGNTDPWAKAGVMIRDSTAAGSSHAFVIVTPGNGTAFQRRTSTGGSSSSTSGPASAAPYWVRLVRSGSTYTAYTSSNGSSWTTVGSQSISMSSSDYIGLAVTSHNDSVLTQAVFDNVSVNGSPISTGSQATAQACVHVAAKPYARVYGGDVAAGGGIVTSVSTPNSCSRNTASVIGWNKRSSGSYMGAGVQFAAYAMSTIFDTATGLGASSGPPSSLSFRNNNTNVAAGNFGGGFLSAPCIANYYANKPDSPPALPASLPSLAPGVYTYANTNPGGNVRLTASTINPGVEVSIYVDGNLYIDGNLTYGGNGSWNSGNIPMLRVIVKGNIFIDNDVGQLDGLYVAQQTAANTNGAIYTCTSGTAPGPYAAPVLGSGGTLATMCDKKLTVNGGFVARQVWLLRTIGTLRASTPPDASGSANIAEVFNYNPALWMSQPSDDPGAADYNAIISLPPVL